MGTSVSPWQRVERAKKRAEKLTGEVMPEYGGGGGGGGGGGVR